MRYRWWKSRSRERSAQQPVMQHRFAFASCSLLLIESQPRIVMAASPAADASSAFDSSTTELQMSGHQSVPCSLSSQQTVCQASDSWDALATRAAIHITGQTYESWTNLHRR